MCYLVKEKKVGMMSSKIERAGYFHYVFGVDLSSTASPSAYIKSVMGLAGHIGMDTPNSKKKSKIQVKSATFCTYDIVTRRDIRVEICFPGSTNVVAYDENGERSNLEGQDWNYVFISS